MRALNLLLVAAAFGEYASAAALPDADVAALSKRAQEQGSSWRTTYENLWKRKGGGGHGSGGGRGGSSSSGESSGEGSSGSSGSSSGSSSSGSGSSGSSSGSSGKGGSSSSSSSGRGSSSSSTGGRTTTGSGVKPSYGGGTYYSGGTTVPYRAGTRSTGGILPFLAVGSVLGFWAFAWPHGAYIYPFSHPYPYHNATTNRNETRPVQCLCDPYQECGCDDNGNSTYFDSLIGNGSYAALNKSVINVGLVNNTDTILINGTLPNGTTASGGTDSPNAAGGLRNLRQAAGWAPVVGTVLALVCLS